MNYKNRKYASKLTVVLDMLMLHGDDFQRHRDIILGDTPKIRSSHLSESAAGLIETLPKINLLTLPSEPSLGGIGICSPWSV